MKEKEIAAFAKEFDQFYEGVEWENEQQHEAAIASFYTRSRVNECLDTLQVMYQQTSEKSDFYFGFNTSISKYLIRSEHNLCDQYLSKKSKVETEKLIAVLQQLQQYSEALHFHHRGAYSANVENELNHQAVAPLATEIGTNSTEQEEVLKIEDVAELTGLSKQTIYIKTSTRTIPFHKPGKLLYFFRSEVIQWMKDSKRKTQKELAIEAMSQIKRR